MCRAHPCAWGPGNVRHAALAPTRPGASQKPAIVAPTEPQRRSGTSSHSHAAPCRRTPEPRQPWKHTTLPPTGTAMAQNRRGGGFLPPCRVHTRHSNYTMNNGRLGSVPGSPCWAASVRVHEPVDLPSRVPSVILFSSMLLGALAAKVFTLSTLAHAALHLSVFLSSGT